MQRKYVTAMSLGIFEKYGHAMLESFCRFWPAGEIHVYTEAGELPLKDPRVKYHLLYEITGLAYFLEGVQHFPIMSGVVDNIRNYRYDVNAYARKAYSQMAAAEGYRGYLYWIDADVTTHRAIPAAMLEGFLTDAFIAVMKRKTWHLCSSFVAWDCGHAFSDDWWAHYRKSYQTGAVFLSTQWDDAFVLGATLNDMPAVRDIAAHIVGEGPYNVFDSVFEGYATHDKGPGKLTSRYDQFIEIVGKVKPGKIVEIGTWNGNRAIQMHRVSPESEYVGFDLFEDGSKEIDQAEKNVKPHQTLVEVDAKLKEAGVPHLLYKGFSSETLPVYLAEHGPGTADLVFIDGGHSVETIRSDFEHAKQICKVGGLIVLDDYYTDMPEDELEKYGAQTVLRDVPHVLLPARDKVQGGGRVQMAVVENGR